MFAPYFKIQTLWYTSISDRYSKEPEWGICAAGMDYGFLETSRNCAAVIVVVSVDEYSVHRSDFWCFL